MCACTIVCVCVPAQAGAGPTQIPWDHIYDPGWRIRLETRKQNIKSKKLPL